MKPRASIRYNAFLNLLPKQVKYIGKITSVDTNGDVTIAPIGAFASSIVKGGTNSYNVDDYVLVKDGIIVSKLDNPQLVLEESII